MKRAVLAAALAAVAALPGLGHAAPGVATGVCNIAGRVDYSPNVKSLPAPLSFVVSGTLTCIENARAGTAGTRLNNQIGFFQGQGSGSIGCTASQGMGTFTMGISTSIEATTRELWEGEFRNAGTAAQGLAATIKSIKNQTLVNNVWQTTSAETIVTSAATGVFLFGVELDDVTTCASQGISNRSFLGNISYTYATA